MLRWVSIQELNFFRSLTFVWDFLAVVKLLSHNRIRYILTKQDFILKQCFWDVWCRFASTVPSDILINKVFTILSYGQAGCSFKCKILDKAWLQSVFPKSSAAFKRETGMPFYFFTCFRSLYIWTFACHCFHFKRNLLLRKSNILWILDICDFARDVRCLDASALTVN